MTRKVLAALPFILAAQLAFGHAALAQDAAAPSASTASLLSTGRTVLGQPLAYPRGAAAHVASAVVTLPVGARTGWHRHDVPVFGYVLKGELTVAYRGRGERVFRPGDAFMEAVGTPHNGRNTGTGPMDILVVYIGTDGVPNTVRTE